jgi:hypothetical protein
MPEFLSQLVDKYPAAVWGAFTAFIWLGQWAVRTFAPRVWRAGALLSLKEKLIVELPPALLPKLLPVVQLAWSTWQALPSALAGALFQAWQDGGSFEDAWKGAAVTTLAPLTHHILKALPIVPYDGKLGPVPVKRLPSVSDRPTAHRSVPPPTYPGAAALLLAGALAIVGALPACSHGPNLPVPTSGAAARQLAKGAFTGSVLLLKAVDEVGFRWQESVTNGGARPTPEQFATSEKLRDVIELGRAALAKAGPCIEAGGSCVEDLSEFVEHAQTAAALVTVLGQKVPDEALDVLDFVAGYVGKGGAQ